MACLQGVGLARRHGSRECYPATLAGSGAKGPGTDSTTGCSAAPGAGFAIGSGCSKVSHTKDDLAPLRESPGVLCCAGDGLFREEPLTGRKRSLPREPVQGLPLPDDRIGVCKRLGRQCFLDGRCPSLGVLCCGDSQDKGSLAGILPCSAQTVHPSGETGS